MFSPLYQIHFCFVKQFCFAFLLRFLNQFLIFLSFKKISLDDYFKYLVLFCKGVIIILLSSLFREAATLFPQILFCFRGACLSNNNPSNKEKN